MNIALVFPGQGAQKVGMGKDLFESSPVAREVFEQADEALGEPLGKLIFEGPLDELTLTANTQPAILTVSIAALRALEKISTLKPKFAAGHSLGEFSALVASGAMDFSDAVRVTRARGEAMQEATPENTGAMSAVMGLTSQVVEEICIEAKGEEVVSPANFNTPSQTVISGHAEAVQRAGKMLKDKGGKVIPLKVSAPFHCSLMKPAAAKLAFHLEKIKFNEPACPIVSNVEASPNTDVQKIANLLIRQVTSPVRWTESLKFMTKSGVSTFFEFGPGNVISGLIKRFDKNLTTITVNSPNGLDKACESLEKL